MGKYSAKAAGDAITARAKETLTKEAMAMMNWLSGSLTKSLVNFWERRVLVEIQQTYCMRVLLRLLGGLVSGGSGTPFQASRL
jgi:hypothetical protein